MDIVESFKRRLQEAITDAVHTITPVVKTEASKLIENTTDEKLEQAFTAIFVIGTLAVLASQAHGAVGRLEVSKAVSTLVPKGGAVYIYNKVTNNYYREVK